MAWELNSDRPIYIQLIDNIKFSIISGKYHSGDRLPSVRDLAKEASVNPNTMQKALSELEFTGLILSNRTSGRYVTDNNELINSVKKELAIEYCNEFLEKLHNLGLSDNEIKELISDINS